SVEDTSLILRNLIWADYATSTRLLFDGRVYLEKEILDKRLSKLDFDIIATHDTNEEDRTCELDIDSGEDGDNYTINTASELMSGEAYDTISFDCDDSLDKITLKVYNFQGKLFYEEVVENTGSITYTLDELYCVGDSNTCDYDAS